MESERKEKLLKQIDKLKEAIIEDKSDFYKYFIGDIAEELVLLKAEQEKKD